MEKVFVGLGSNSPDAVQMLARARDGMAALPGVCLGAASRIYYTEPQQYLTQPWFHNQVVELNVDASWTPDKLMDALLALEQTLGRSRTGSRFGPRCIDLDILLFGSRVSDTPHCILPHPRMHRRAFVLVPLAEIAPSVLIRGGTPAVWLKALNWHEDTGKIYQSG